MKNIAMKSWKSFALSLSLVLALSTSGAVAQMPNFGSIVGGAGGGIAGAIIGMAAGAIIQGLIDDIERQKAKEAANRALKSGKGGTASFRNSKGQQVRVATKTRTYKAGNGQSCREITTSVQRDGRADGGGGTQTKCVQVASSGAPNYGMIQ